MVRKRNFQGMGVILRNFYDKYYQITLFLVLISKFDQKLNFQPWLAWTRPYKSLIGHKREENVIFKKRE